MWLQLVEDEGTVADPISPDKVSWAVFFLAAGGAFVFLAAVFLLVLM